MKKFDEEEMDEMIVKALDEEVQSSKDKYRTAVLNH